MSAIAILTKCHFILLEHHPAHIILTWLRGENNDFKKISSQEKLTFANASISTGIVALNSSVWCFSGRLLII
jgi:hypothetical protein